MDGAIRSLIFSMEMLKSSHHKLITTKDICSLVCRWAHLMELHLNERQKAVIKHITDILLWISLCADWVKNSNHRSALSVIIPGFEMSIFHFYFHYAELPLSLSSWVQICSNPIEMDGAKCFLREISILLYRKKCCQQKFLCQLATKNALPGNLRTSIDLRRRERDGGRWGWRNGSPRWIEM